MELEAEPGGEAGARLLFALLLLEDSPVLCSLSDVTLSATSNAGEKLVCVRWKTLDVLTPLLHGEVYILHTHSVSLKVLLLQLSAASACIYDAIAALRRIQAVKNPQYHFFPFISQ